MPKGVRRSSTANGKRLDVRLESARPAALLLYSSIFSASRLQAKVRKRLRRSWAIACELNRIMEYAVSLFRYVWLRKKEKNSVEMLSLNNRYHPGTSSQR